MEPVTADELLTVWEEGRSRHPLDRALMLAAWGQPDWPIEAIPDYPVGQVNYALFKLRRRIFGQNIQTVCACRHCGETLDITFNLDEFICEDNHGMEFTSKVLAVDVDHYQFRIPTTRDLSRIVQLKNETDAAHQLLKDCQIAQEPHGIFNRLESRDLQALLPRVSHALEALDPHADTSLNLLCKCCGQSFEVALDIAQYLWDEITLKAKTLLQEIDALARAYGWREHEILSLKESRRKAYLEMVLA
jgi:hypothetical protein